MINENNFLKKNILSFLDAKKMSIPAFCKLVGQKYHTVDALISGKTNNPRLFTILPIAQYIGLPIEDIAIKPIDFKALYETDNANIEQAECNHAQRKLNEALWNAIAENVLPKAKLLIKEGADLLALHGMNLRSINLDQESPLHIAAKNGYMESIKFLVAKEFPINIVNRYNQTPLQWACYNGHLAIVKVLINAGADIEWKDYEQDTPLIWAAASGHLDIVKFLMSIGAMTLQMGNQGTALHWAARNGHLETLKYLISLGMNPLEKNKDGLTPIGIAKNHGQSHILKFFA